MFVSHKALNVWNLETEFFRRGEEGNQRRLAEEEATVTAYRIPLAPVTSFNYLGRVLPEADDDWQVAVHKLRRAW